MQNYYSYFAQIQSQLKDILIIPHFSQDNLVLVDVISSNKIGQIGINGNHSVLYLNGNEISNFGNELIVQEIMNVFSKPTHVSCSITNQPHYVISQDEDYAKNQQGFIPETSPTIPKITSSTRIEGYQLSPQPNLSLSLSQQTKPSQVSQNMSQMTTQQDSRLWTVSLTRKEMKPDECEKSSCIKDQPQIQNVTKDQPQIQNVTKDIKTSVSKVKQTHDIELKSSTNKRNKEKADSANQSSSSHRIDNSNQLHISDTCVWSLIK
ncbi:hypothetical protein EHI8A_129260 [Entamoeba histolytica HM-1:IMSS-B]|uniref:Uncharacterized protein n=6 Tax=Entamoeba histolytica TaxID=5759 RepID=C4MBN0_ENTH1|nr:hypothetical protein EHI_078410 [Entamoeba histolytica HM-1:IMSS]EMD45586.1 Hypothetical protein EHI5A_163670 [Entamoeba histolytica KU27]EMH73214.1 hypothetical protein EHI8A_129260 [Entamoeba histolytica HM-1:IMSS-B]EMS11586.1 hypothetical protein KM1_202340 [Entamoeba histolytica HM-3:IMSS]ENY60390.1 hypothetical protein EHI7A_120160 [Entamoeba histolytica HM-1:IMSS-A]GAT99460.1 hypothetical protein CL6EHI_078410 [Entamoeba histolytica]|eukprot:XP_652384.1 hypothetical protein EHI_078410 [Entamoeba histolytica HM-1:IMSS]